VVDPLVLRIIIGTTRDFLVVVDGEKTFIVDMLAARRAAANTTPASQRDKALVSKGPRHHGGQSGKKNPVQSFIKGIFAATFLSAVFLSVGSFLLAVITLVLGPVASLTLATQSYRGLCPHCGNDVCGHAPVFQCHLARIKFQFGTTLFTELSDLSAAMPRLLSSNGSVINCQNHFLEVKKS
jgi:hypothetical protein